MTAVGGGPPGVAGPEGAAEARATTLPNVVIVLTDDQRTGTLTRMPRLWSSIRKKGVEFPNAGVPTSLCCPSRASLLTGLYAHSTRVFSNALPYGGYRTFNAQRLQTRTIATALDALGYHTALVGKYLNGGFPRAARRGYVPPGWDEFVTFASPLRYYDYRLNDGHWYGDAPRDYSTDVLARHAVRAVRTAPAGEPLFLYFAPVSPHRPFVPAPRHVGAWEGRIPSYRPRAVRENVADKPWWVRKYPRSPQRQIDRDVVRTQEMLMSVDDAVGGIVDALRDTGRLHDTLFVYLSDNGVLLGEHHLLEWKNVPYRWSTSIPLLVRWDGHVPPGTSDTRLALNVDVAATVRAATGAALDTEGLNLLGPTRRNGYPLEATRWFRFDSRPEHPAYCGFRTRRWMFAQYANGFRELYDYRHDPQELDNRAGSKRSAGVLDALRARARATCRPRPPGFHW